MPLYEYQCGACEHRFEVIQKFSDARITVCPKCGGAVEKLPSSPAIQFKGTGWYITDYARAGKSEATTPPGKSDSAGSKDDKPAAPASASGSESGSSAESKSTESKSAESKSATPPPATPPPAKAS